MCQYRKEGMPTSNYWGRRPQSESLGDWKPKFFNGEFSILIGLKIRNFDWATLREGVFNMPIAVKESFTFSFFL